MISKINSIVFLVLALAITAFAQDDAYYKAIQKDSSTRIEPKQFKKMEETAFKDYAKPESYEQLANAFGNGSEKVWAVIYGEVYCNLLSDPEHIKQVGSQVFQWYEGSLSKHGDQLSISLTKNAQSSRSFIPFESQFEINFVMGAAALKVDPKALTISKLTQIRKTQITTWIMKKLPKNELIRRQEAIISAGHFEAYNYWLFRDARTEEFNEWLRDNKTKFDAWLDWQSQNKFSIQSPDFQRLYLIRNF